MRRKEERLFPFPILITNWNKRRNYCTGFLFIWGVFLVFHFFPYLTFQGYWHLIKLVAAQKRKADILLSLDYLQILIITQLVASNDHKKKEGNRKKFLKLKILQKKRQKKSKSSNCQVINWPIGFFKSALNQFLNNWDLVCGHWLWNVALCWD